MRVPELTDDALRLDDLSIARGTGSSRVRAVDGVSAVLPFGRALCIAGPTGSGKSSLALALAGEERGDLAIVGGSAVVCGVDAEHPGRARSVLTYRTGYLAQDAGPTLDPDRPIGETIVLPILAREPRADQHRLAKRVAHLLDEVRLPLGVADRFPHELSAGMRQRVALARALVMDPRLLIADEPLAGIDVEVRKVVRQAILRRRAEWGMAVLAVTNDALFAEEIGADRLVMDRSVIVARQDAGGEPIVTPGYEHATAFLDAPGQVDGFDLARSV